MSDDAEVPVRREPPPFRRMRVRRIAMLSPHMARVTFHGPELDGLEIPPPAASVRLLIPSPGDTDLEIPTWRGNEFLRADHGRPTIRTFTPRYVRSEPAELDLDIVLHPGGAVSDWVRKSEVGDTAAVSGTGRGYVVAPQTTGYLLAGDQTAIPAMSQIVEALSPSVTVRAIIEAANEDAEQDLPAHPQLEATWVFLDSAQLPGNALLPAIRQSDLEPGSKVWAAGEAGAMHRIRRHLFDERGLNRADATVRGYWKRGR